ncbi:hypothetical protein BC829DRAFT_382654 [Chytridium lagenaria]|nr:hypothetical protein BC829DRAFT_382654 [Chytridium lagenaria]
MLNLLLSTPGRIGHRVISLPRYGLQSVTKTILASLATSVSKKEPLAPPRNEDIPHSSIFVVSHGDKPSRLTTVSAVLAELDRQKYDLVLVRSQQSPPVHRAPKAQQTKEIEVRTNIGPHDLDIKCKKITELLLKGCKVSITVTESGKGEQPQALFGMLSDRLRSAGIMQSKPSQAGKKWRAVFVCKK